MEMNPTQTREAVTNQSHRQILGMIADEEVQVLALYRRCVARMIRSASTINTVPKLEHDQ